MIKFILKIFLLLYVVMIVPAPLVLVYYGFKAVLKYLLLGLVMSALISVVFTISLCILDSIVESYRID